MEECVRIETIIPTLSGGVFFLRASPISRENDFGKQMRDFSRVARVGKVAWNSRTATIIVKRSTVYANRANAGIRSAGEYYRRINFLTLIFPARELASAKITRRSSENRAIVVKCLLSRDVLTSIVGCCAPARAPTRDYSNIRRTRIQLLRQRED